MVDNCASLMDDMVAIYMDEIEPVKTAAGILPSLIFQPITTDMISHFSKNGGNALGLDGEGPLNRMYPQSPLQCANVNPLGSCAN
jgi:hypothetical protein